MAWYSFCSQSNSGCGGVNLSGHGDPASPSGYRQDYSVPLSVGSTITSPVKGIVLPQHTSGYLSLFGKQDWGGETDILTYLPMYDRNNPVVVTVLHYDSLDPNLRGGAVVDQTSQLGTSGGQTSGGHWPSNPKDSTGPHVGIAVRPYNSWGNYYDPTPLMNQLLSGVDPSGYPTLPQLRKNEFIDLTTYEFTSSKSGQIGLTNPLDPIAQIGAGIAFLTDTNHWKRLAKIVAGALLLLVGIVATVFGPALPEIAAAGTTAAGFPEAAETVRATLGGKGRQRVARTALAGTTKVRGTRIIRRREQKEQAEAEERVAEKTAEKTAGRVNLNREPIPRGTGPGGQYTTAEYRRYFGGTGDIQRRQRIARAARTPQGKAPLGRTTAKFSAPSAANQAARRNKEAREKAEKIREGQRQRGRQNLSGRPDLRP